MDLGVARQDGAVARAPDSAACRGCRLWWRQDVTVSLQDLGFCHFP